MVVPTAASAPKAAAVPASSLRGLVLIVGMDLLLGLWLKLHCPKALPWFFLINTPTIGVTAFIWGLIPKRQQERVSEALGSVLEHRRTQRVLFGVILALAAASLFFGALSVTLLDPGTTTTIHVVRGSQSTPDSAAVANAGSFRLDRLSTPHYTLLRIWPVGTAVWLYSPTQVLFLDARLWPWLPANIQYPGDFVPFSQVAVLAHPDILERLMQRDLTLVFHLGASSDEVARVPLSDTAAIVGFLRPAPVSNEDMSRWFAWLDSLPHDPDTARITRFHRDMETRWQHFSWVRSRRPLHEGDTLTWEVRTRAGSVIVQDRLPLDAHTADLHLKF